MDTTQNSQSHSPLSYPAASPLADQRHDDDAITGVAQPDSAPARLLDSKRRLNQNDDSIQSASQTPSAWETSSSVANPENPGIAGNQGISAGKSLGNDREIPGDDGKSQNSHASSNLALDFPILTNLGKHDAPPTKRLDDWNRCSGLGDLNPDDASVVAELCEEFTYREVKSILAQPRPEGLNLKTSISSLQRFYASYRSEAMAEENDVAQSQIKLILQDAGHDDDALAKAAKHLLKRRLLEASISPVSSTDEICRLFGMLERIRLTDLAERRLALEEQKLAQKPNAQAQTATASCHEIQPSLETAASVRPDTLGHTMPAVSREIQPSSFNLQPLPPKSTLNLQPLPSASSVLGIVQTHSDTLKHNNANPSDASASKYQPSSVNPQPSESDTLGHDKDNSLLKNSVLSPHLSELPRPRGQTHSDTHHVSRERTFAMGNKIVEGLGSQIHNPRLQPRIRLRKTAALRSLTFNLHPSTLNLRTRAPRLNPTFRPKRCWCRSGWKNPKTGLPCIIISSPSALEAPPTGWIASSGISRNFGSKIRPCSVSSHEQRTRPF